MQKCLQYVNLFFKAFCIWEIIYGAPLYGQGQHGPIHPGGERGQRGPVHKFFS